MLWSVRYMYEAVRYTCLIMLCMTRRSGVYVYRFDLVCVCTLWWQGALIGSVGVDLSIAVLLMYSVTLWWGNEQSPLLHGTLNQAPHFPCKSIAIVVSHTCTHLWYYSDRACLLLCVGTLVAVSALLKCLCWSNIWQLSADTVCLVLAHSVQIIQPITLLSDW